MNKVADDEFRPDCPWHGGQQPGA